MVIHVDDFLQPGLAPYARLTERELRAVADCPDGLFIAESPKVIERALDAGFEPMSFLMEEKHCTGDAAFLLERCPEVPVYTAPRAQLESLTGYTLTRGVLCAFKRKPLAALSSVLSQASRVAVLENITDAVNVGSIFRSAAALGIDAILLSPGCCDPLNRRCVRVSMGNVFFIPWTRVVAENADWPARGMQALHEAGFKTLSMALRNNSIDIQNPVLHSEPRLAVLLGNEGDGLLSETIDTSDYVVKIPMKAGVDSLNVASAAVIAFWELAGNLPEAGEKLIPVDTFNIY
ncbi:MAG: RNA methyltransferase [Treponema sp.]|nr:RNA methyltransferase [Treponema sp.]